MLAALSILAVLFHLIILFHLYNIKLWTYYSIKLSINLFALINPFGILI